MKYYFCGDLWPFLVKVIIWWPRKINCIIQKRTFGQIIWSDIFLMPARKFKLLSDTNKLFVIQINYEYTRLITPNHWRLHEVASKYAFLYFSSFLNQAQNFESLFYFRCNLLEIRFDHARVTKWTQPLQINYI